MKVIIPVAGAGTQLRPHTYTQPKALIPMAGKTILGVILDQLVPYDFEEYIFIVGYLGDKIKDYILTNYPSINAQFVTQTTRKGTGHAIALTKSEVKNEEVLIIYGDTICDFDLGEIINNSHSVIGVKRVDDPRNFGVAELNIDNKVVKVVEKPNIPKSNMAMVGIYKVKETQQMFAALDAMIEGKTEKDGEYHFTSILQTMISNGIIFDAYKMKNWFDCGKKETLLETNQTLLKKMMENNEEMTQEVTVIDSVIIPPVNIGKGTVLKNTIIGPSVSVGENTTITSSIIKNTIIGNFATLNEVVLDSSIIGSDAYVKGMRQSLNIGDNTEIDFS
jgi:glucose-1-phosphate thymidylyltransferase